MRNVNDVDPTAYRRLSNAATYANLSKEILPRALSTGLRSNIFRFGALCANEPPRIAEEFMINSRLVRNDVEVAASVGSYLSDLGLALVSNLGEEQPNTVNERTLPKNSIRLNMSLGEAMRRRRSSRGFTGDRIDLETLATILRSCAQETGIGEVDLEGTGKARLRFRAVPSGGGLYPLEVYVASLRVKGLECGVYRYNARRDVFIETCGKPAVDAIASSLAVPEEFISLTNANAIFLFIGVPWRSMRKYGARGLRFLFIEAGAMAQNVHLACAALGLGSLDCASLYDDEVHDAIGVDGLYEALVHAVIVGHAAGLPKSAEAAR
jgi:SagB-type dehydrogenase family enzyme